MLSLKGNFLQFSQAWYSDHIVKDSSSYIGHETFLYLEVTILDPNLE